MRAFTAVDIENPETLRKLQKVQEEINYGFNKTIPEKMHLTLQFFQDIGPEQVEEVEKGMQNIDLEPFEMQIKGVGVFPSRKHVRVVWAGIESEKIFELKNQVSNHSVPEDNDHDFLPHITLARVNGISRTEEKNFRQKLEELKEKNIAKLKVDSVKLFESVHNEINTEYRVLGEKKL